MGMNIKDQQVHAMARALSDHRVANLTEAVRHALRAELDRCLTAAPGQEEVARRHELLLCSAAAGMSPGRINAEARNARRSSTTTRACPQCRW
jgi:hypothetical protein